MVLYKYLAVEKLDTLINGHILASPVRYLNDPWEFRLDFRNTNEHLRKVYAELHRESYEAQSPLDPNRLPKEPTEAGFQAYSAHMNSREQRREQTEDFIIQMSERIGIVSLSSDPFSRLMWAHYASAQKGIAVGFRIEEGTEKDGVLAVITPLGLALKVEYSPERCTLTDRADGAAHFFRRKHPDWTYEKEWRVFREIQPGKVDFLSQKDGKTFYGAPCPASAVDEIVFGLATSEPDRERVLSWFKQGDRKKIITVRHLKIDDKTNDLVFDHEVKPI